MPRGAATTYTWSFYKEAKYSYSCFFYVFIYVCFVCVYTKTRCHFDLLHISLER